MGRVEQPSKAATLRAFTASKPSRRVISSAAFKIISRLTFAVGGMALASFYAQQMLHNYCYT